MKISIITPTCFRPQMFREMMDSLSRTTETYYIEHIVLVDKDTETYAIANEYNCIVDYSTKMRGACECWNIGLTLSTGDIIVPGGDDHLYHPNWLSYALESHQKEVGGYGVIGMNDLAYDGNLQVATMFLFDRYFCREVLGGVIAPPVYNYYCIDMEINEHAKLLNRFYWDSRSVIEHRHSAHGKRPIDQHDTYRMDHDYMTIDNKTYLERKAQGFPITWKPRI